VDAEDEVRFAGDGLGKIEVELELLRADSLVNQVSLDGRIRSGDRGWSGGEWFRGERREEDRGDEQPTGISGAAAGVEI
jgi:hypothetical protein